MSGKLRILVLLGALALAACGASEIAKEDFGLGVHIGQKSGAIGNLSAELAKKLPNAKVTTGFGSISIADEKNDFVLTAADLDKDNRIDKLTLRYRTYVRSRYGAGEAIRGRKEEEFLSIEKLQKFSEAFAKQVPEVKTTRGVTLGATKAQIQEAYGYFATIAWQKGMREILAYRFGELFIYFLLFAGRTVEICAIKPSVPIEEHLKEATGWKLEGEEKKSIFKEQLRVPSHSGTFQTH